MSRPFWVPTFSTHVGHLLLLSRHPLLLVQCHDFVEETTP